MLLSTPKVKVIHVTTHIGLIDAVASPIYATAVGLVQYGVRHGGPQPVHATNGAGILGRMRGWLREMVQGA